jgi:hypothetical protein
VGQSDTHSLLDREKSVAHAVQFVVVVSQRVQVLSHSTHMLFITISLVFRHSGAQVKDVVRTREGSQDVQVEVELAQVWQFESQDSQVLPVLIVVPVAQVLTHVLLLKSRFILELQDAQLVVVPVHVLQFELQATHSPRVSFWMYNPLVHDVKQILSSKYLKSVEESHEVQLVAEVSQFKQCAMVVSHASQVKATLLPKVVSGHEAIHVPLCKNSNPVKPHTVQTVLSVVEHAPHDISQFSHSFVVEL